MHICHILQGGDEDMKPGFFKQAAITIAILFSASAAQALPLTLVSHNGTATSTASAPPAGPDSESDTSVSAADVNVQTSALSTLTVTGTGSGGAGPGTGPGGPGVGGGVGDPIPPSGGTIDFSVESASASTNDIMSTTAGTNSFSFSHGVTFQTDGLNSGGNASAIMNAVWVMSMNAANVDLTYSVSALMIGTANNGSMLTVRNMTANTTILSLTDPAAIGSTVLNFAGSIGDIIQIDVNGQSSFIFGPGGSNVLNATSYSLEFAESLATVPEAGTLLLLAGGLAGFAVAGRHRRR